MAKSELVVIGQMPTISDSLADSIPSSLSSSSSGMSDHLLDNLVESLQKVGFKPHRNVDTVSAVSLIDQFSPDAVLLCLEEESDMPSVLASIRAEYETLPVILLGQPNQSELMVSLMKNGASDYFATPEVPDLLAQTVQRAVDIHDELQQSRLRELQLQKKNKKLGKGLAQIEQDQLAGLRVQQSMLPTSPASLLEYEFSYQIQPSLILSGDSINYFALDSDTVCFYLADVSGHGAAGAIVTGALTSLAHRLAAEFLTLNLKNSADVLGWFNHELLSLHLEHHVTMFLGLIDSRRNVLSYSNAAHFPATILATSEDAQFLEMGGLPLGICENQYENCEAQLGTDAHVVLFSDGVLEILPEGSIQEKENYLLSLVQSGFNKSELLADQLGLDDVSDVPDDIALLTVTRKS